MNRLEHLLTCVAEECTEVGQRATKALRFGLDEVQPGQDLNNWDRILVEYFDLVSVLIMVAMEAGKNPKDLVPNPEVVEAKCQRVESLMGLARSGGALQ